MTNKTVKKEYLKSKNNTKRKKKEKSKHKNNKNQNQKKTIKRKPIVIVQKGNPITIGEQIFVKGPNSIYMSKVTGFQIVNGKISPLFVQ
jgi:hypothetical protein